MYYIIFALFYVVCTQPNVIAILAMDRTIVNKAIYSLLCNQNYHFVRVRFILYYC